MAQSGSVLKKRWCGCDWFDPWRCSCDGDNKLDLEASAETATNKDMIRQPWARSWARSRRQLMTSKAKRAPHGQCLVQQPMENNKHRTDDYIHPKKSALR